VAKDRKIDAEDACPIPPGVEILKKSELGSLTNMILQVDWRVVLPVFSVGLFLTVYGLLIPLLPLFSLPEDPDTWNQSFSQSPIFHYIDMRNWIPRFSKQVVHEGDLILNSSEVFVIENCTYFVNGMVCVSDDARLVLRNAELWIKKTTTWSSNTSIPMADLLLTNSSRLEAFKSSIVTDSDVEIVLIDNSSADIRGSNFTNSVLIGLGDASLEIDQSVVYGIDLGNKASVTVNDSEIDFLGVSWTSLRTFPPLKGYSWTDTCAQVYNSTIVMLNLRAVGSSISVLGNLGGWHQSWSPSNIIQGGRFFNVTLRESDVERVFLIADNSTVYIRDNSDILALSMYGGSLTFANNSISGLGIHSSKIDVSDSVLNNFNPWDESVGNVTRTFIEYFSLEEFNGSLRLKQVKAISIWLGGSSGRILGDIQITRTWPPINDFNDPGISSPPTMLKRGYEVLAEAEGKAAEGVELTLRNSQNETLWTGKTDVSGRATFNVTYYHIWKLHNYNWLENATSTLTMTARVGETEQAQNVTIVSASPIIFNFAEAPEHPVWADKTTLTLSGTIIMIGAVSLAAMKRRRKI